MGPGTNFSQWRKYFMDQLAMSCWNLISRAEYYYQGLRTNSCRSLKMKEKDRQPSMSQTRLLLDCSVYMTTSKMNTTTNTWWGPTLVQHCQNSRLMQNNCRKTMCISFRRAKGLCNLFAKCTNIYIEKEIVCVNIRNDSSWQRRFWRMPTRWPFISTFRTLLL